MTQQSIQQICVMLSINEFEIIFMQNVEKGMYPFVSLKAFRVSDVQTDRVPKFPKQGSVEHWFDMVLVIKQYPEAWHVFLIPTL